MLAIEAAAVVLKAAVVAPAATVTDAGTVSRVLLLASVTLDPPVGAVSVSVTVQVPAALCPKLAGLQVNVNIDSGADRLTVVVVEALPRVAVRVTL